MSATPMLAEVREMCRRHGLAPNAGARRRFGRNLAALTEAQAAELLAALRAMDEADPRLEPARETWQPGDGIGPAPACMSRAKAAEWCRARAR